MSSPYREQAIPDRDRFDRANDEAKPLAAFDASGTDGRSGAWGTSGADAHGSGSDGGRGSDAGPATSGQAAGSFELTLSGGDTDGIVQLRGKLVAANNAREDIKTSVVIDERGFIALDALGGDGGAGGNGGRGGDGARG